MPIAAQVAPLSATLPITYRWQATDLPQQVTVVASTESAALFLWSVPGVKQVALTASNAFTSLTASHIVFVAATSVTVPSGQTGTLVYTHSLYPTTTVQVPVDALNQSMRLSYVPIEGVVAAPSGLIFANHHFELVLEFLNEDVFAAQTDVVFDRPLGLTITYRDANVANAHEAGLRLLNWTGSEWRVGWFSLRRVRRAGSGHDQQYTHPVDLRDGTLCALCAASLGLFAAGGARGVRCTV